MLQRLIVVSALCCAACSTTPSSNPGHSCAQYTLCTPNGSTVSCDCGGGTYPECPASASEGDPCDTPGVHCMGCYQGANFTCTCSDAGPRNLADAAGPAWFCVGGGQACPM